MTEPILKPCPFCTEKASMQSNFDYGNWVNFSFIYCKNLECKISQNYHFTPEESIKAWNTRPLEEKYNKLLFYIKKEARLNGKISELPLNCGVDLLEIVKDARDLLKEIGEI